MINVTRLRYIIAASPEMLVAAVELLGYKVEIKGAPIPIKNGWILYFVLPENEGVKFESKDLRV